MDDYKRQEGSNALINRDMVSLDAYKKRKKTNLRAQTIEQDINIIKSEFEEIKTLLKQLLNKE